MGEKERQFTFSMNISIACKYLWNMLKYLDNQKRNRGWSHGWKIRRPVMSYMFWMWRKNAGFSCICIFVSFPSVVSTIKKNHRLLPVYSKDNLVLIIPQIMSIAHAFISSWILNFPIPTRCSNFSVSIFNFLLNIG